MAELVKIEDTELAIREYNGQRVVALRILIQYIKDQQGQREKLLTETRIGLKLENIILFSSTKGEILMSTRRTLEILLFQIEG